MIDKLAIATNGYRSLDRGKFSIAVDGYYILNAIAVITVPRKTQGDDAEKDTRHKGEYQHLFRERKHQEDEELVNMIGLITKILYR